ncbi:gem-associated protein 2 isoform X2 [Sphaerodactylus townsendi]|uniref:gem-associated protein 2 isoform X2 n=1 Tax=Sphaerodactylus townsendi TaxID=933632 RepID=UPI002025EBB3|nr:gem-associated protein 2 isoform X2 [Sphaerodactylus townsendi]
MRFAFPVEERSAAGRAAMESTVEELMPCLLPVEDCDIPEDFDPTVPPRTPQEYLKRVQIEAAKCPDVVVAQIDPRKLKKKQTVNISLSGCLPAPEGYSPTLRWQQQQVSHFSAVRQSVNKHRDHWKSQHLDSNVTMPKSDDEEGWKKFCLGEKLYLNTGVQVSNDENQGIDYVQGRWLYALLACLEKPLLPEAHSLIRQLARRCSEVRVLEENKNENRVSALNLLICLVGRYFDQYDLADEPS